MKKLHLMGSMIGSVLFFLGSVVIASEAVDFGDSNLDKENVIKSLQLPSNAGGQSKSLSKGIRVRPGEEPSLSMRVQFEFDSYRLKAASQRNLDVVAEALNSGSLAGNRFRIEGHTDASGSEGYNLRLSEQRAQAVFDYLVNRGGVSARRLMVVSHGEFKLLGNIAPTSPLQRRVVIANLGNSIDF